MYMVVGDITMVTKKSTVNKNVPISIDIYTEEKTMFYECNNIYKFDSDYKNINDARKAIINIITKRKTINKIIMWRYWDFGIGGKEILGIYYG